MSLFGVFSPRTVEPNRPKRVTPTAESSSFNVLSRFITDFFFMLLTDMLPFAKIILFAVMAVI